MSKTLRTPIWQRVRNLQISLGPVGAALTLDLDSRAEDVMALVPEIERAIEDRLGVRYVTDPELQIGQWFVITGTPMTYCIPDIDSSGVLFLGEDGVRFILGGSAEYLLDRRAPDIEKAKDIARHFGSSSLGGILNLLHQLEMYDKARSDDDEARIDERLSPSYPNPNYLPYIFPKVRNIFGSEPMTALGRCLEIAAADRDGMTTVIGTPLYVAFEAPK